MLARLALSTSFLLALATCGSSSSGTTDASKKDSSAGQPDAVTGVETVACPATPDAEISNVTGAYVVAPPGSGSAATISVGQIVQFTTTSQHDVTPNSGVDPGVHVGFSQTAVCKKFTVAGTFTFQCSLHHFMGSVIVQ